MVDAAVKKGEQSSLCRKMCSFNMSPEIGGVDHAGTTYSLVIDPPARNSTAMDGVTLSEMLLYG